MIATASAEAARACENIPSGILEARRRRACRRARRAPPTAPVPRRHSRATARSRARTAPRYRAASERGAPLRALAVRGANRRLPARICRRRRRAKRRRVPLLRRFRRCSRWRFRRVRVADPPGRTARTQRAKAFAALRGSARSPIARGCARTPFSPVRFRTRSPRRSLAGSPRGDRLRRRRSRPARVRSERRARDGDLGKTGEAKGRASVARRVRAHRADRTGARFRAGVAGGGRGRSRRHPAMPRPERRWAFESHGAGAEGPRADRRDRTFAPSR